MEASYEVSLLFLCGLRFLEKLPKVGVLERESVIFELMLCFYWN